MSSYNKKWLIFWFTIVHLGHFMIAFKYIMISCSGKWMWSIMVSVRWSKLFQFKSTWSCSMVFFSSSDFRRMINIVIRRCFNRLNYWSMFILYSLQYLFIYLSITSIDLNILKLQVNIFTVGDLWLFKF